MQIRALEKTKSSFGSPGGGLLSRNNENIIAADLDLNAQVRSSFFGKIVRLVIFSSKTTV